MSLTAGAGLSPSDDITGLDAAVAADGSVHVVWRELLDALGDYRWHDRLVYRRASGTPLRWGPRVVIADGGTDTGNPRLVATRDGMHILAGAHLHHWWLPAGGAPTRDLGNLLADASLEAGSFDAIASNDGLVAAFAGAGPDERNIGAIAWTPAGRRTPVRIAAYGRSHGASVRLLRENGRLAVAWADNTLIQYRDPRDGMMAVTGQSGVRMAASPDEGKSWGPVARIAVPDTSDIVGLAVDSGSGFPRVFYTSTALFATELRAGAWTPPMAIAKAARGFFQAAPQASAAAATRCEGRLALAWVDARHRRSDRRWWNPLGGFPWGDDPDWDNNDLFVATDVPRSATAAAALEPSRLTTDLSMTKDVAIVARDGGLLVFRSGRARVRKASNDAGAPPEVTETGVPCGRPVLGARRTARQASP